MAFGQSITDITRDSIGTYGYIAKVNTVDLKTYVIEEVQAQADPSDTPAPVTAGVSRDTLFAYLNDSGCPDLAFCDAEGECNIFLKTSEFPYLSTTRIALFGKRIAQDATTDSDKLDVPDRDIELVKAYALKDAYITKKNGYVPKGVSDTIKVEERRINNE